MYTCGDGVTSPSGDGEVHDRRAVRVEIEIRERRAAGTQRLGGELAVARGPGETRWRVRPPRCAGRRPAGRWSRCRARAGRSRARRAVTRHRIRCARVDVAPHRLHDAWRGADEHRVVSLVAEPARHLRALAPSAPPAGRRCSPRACRAACRSKMVQPISDTMTASARNTTGGEDEPAPRRARARLPRRSAVTPADPARASASSALLTPAFVLSPELRPVPERKRPGAPETASAGPPPPLTTAA